MKLKTNYLVIPLFVLAIAWLGSFLTSRGMVWYQTLTLPVWTPSGGVIGAAWTIIFILSALAALIFWHKSPHNKQFREIAWLFVLNGVLNVFWSFVFFDQRLIGASILEMLALELTVIALIAIIWRTSKLASALLAPYALWVAFATYLAYAVWQLNG